MTIPVDALAHYGVKGMHWGVRKAERNSPTVTIHTNPAKNKRVKITGGKGHSIHDDAKTALEIQQKAKASGVHTLSNAELQVATQRLNLEQQLARQTSPNKGEAQKFVEQQLKQIGQQHVQTVVKNRAANAGK